MEGKTRINRKIISFTLFGFSLFYLLSILGLKMGTPKKPGPGFIPVGIGALLGFIALAVTYRRMLFSRFVKRGQVCS
jgi:hypothetical protein